MIITDMVDRLILDTYGGFINTCPDQKLCSEIIPYLAPIQMGEKGSREILMVNQRGIRYVLLLQRTKQSRWQSVR